MTPATTQCDVRLTDTSGKDSARASREQSALDRCHQVVIARVLRVDVTVLAHRVRLLLEQEVVAVTRRLVERLLGLVRVVNVEQVRVIVVRRTARLGSPALRVVAAHRFVARRLWRRLTEHLRTPSAYCDSCTYM